MSAIAGSVSGGHAEDLEQRRVPLGSAELGPRRGRRIGGEPGAEPVAEERVDGAQPQGPGVARPADRLVVLEQPGELAGREVGVERHAAALAHLVGASIGLEPVQHLLRALVLPGDDRGQRRAALGVPGEHRLALVVEAAGGDLAAARRRAARRPPRPRPSRTSSGSCSTQPGFGCVSAFSRRASATGRRSASKSTALTAEVPSSMPSSRFIRPPAGPAAPGAAAVRRHHGPATRGRRARLERPRGGRARRRARRRSRRRARRSPAKPSGRWSGSRPR